MQFGTRAGIRQCISYFQLVILVQHSSARRRFLPVVSLCTFEFPGVHPPKRVVIADLHLPATTYFGNMPSCMIWILQGFEYGSIITLIFTPCGSLATNPCYLPLKDRVLSSPCLPRQALHPRLFQHLNIQAKATANPIPNGTPDTR